MRELGLLAAWFVEFVLTALPMAAGAAAAARCGVRSVVACLGVGLAAFGMVGFVGFWAYLVSHLTGEVFSWTVPVVCALILAWALRRRGSWAWLLRPLGLWASASLFVTALGFTHGGYTAPLVMARARFTAWGLPGDNELPSYWAEWFFRHGHHGTPPLYGDWLFSDRPPIQTGFYLLHRPLWWGDPLFHYQLMGVALQQVWVVGLWALLLSAGVRARVRGTAMAVVLLSGLTIVNAFFVWPKLLGAGFVLAAASLVWSTRQTGWRRGLLVATLSGLAMMSHGTSLFAALPLALITLRRGLPDRRWWIAAFAGALVVMTPWSVYQSVGDPPGDRLIKYQFAGVQQVTSQGALSTLVDAYRHAGVSRTLENKAENYWMMLDPGPLWQPVAQLRHGPRAFVKNWISVQFYRLVPMLGLWLVGPLLLLIRRRRAEEAPRERSFALAALGIAAAGCLVWGLVLWGGRGYAVLHVGTYVVPMLALVGCVAAVEATASRLAEVMAVIWCLVNLLCYLTVAVPLPGTRQAPVLVLVALAAALAFLGLLVPARSRGRRRIVTATPV